MKKLISVFAALALVGSLAAQKRKAAPKAPAKPAAPAAPAVAAPAAPAVAMPAAPAMEHSGKGMGLFVEARGTFTLGQGTSDSQIDGAANGATTTATAGKLTYVSGDYKLPNTSGFGGGASLGYEIVPGLAIVASYDYRSIKSREWKQTTASVAVGTADLAIQNVTNTQILGLGFRPSIKALGGTVYAGFGFAYVLPSDSVTTINMSNASSSIFAVTQQKTTASRNAGIGAYAELGYNFPLSDNLYLGVGFRAVVATANNDGKTSVTETTGTLNGSAVATTTTNYSASVNTANDTASSLNRPYTSTGITDAGVNINVGFRF